MNNYVRYYRIADITFKVESDLPFKDNTFKDQIGLFRVDTPGQDMVTIHHHFALPDLKSQDWGKQVYRKAPWAIYQQHEGWLYQGILPEGFEEEFWTIAIFNQDHSKGHIYHKDGEIFLNGNLGALTMLPTDQILIARLLAGRKGCYLHSAGAILDGAGIMFVGHSEAGKSTIIQMLMDTRDVDDPRQKQAKVEILCDDRNIVRYQEGGWRVYGTWSHGDISMVSPASAPLKAICFLQQAGENMLTRLDDPREINRRLLACLIKPFVAAGWWDKALTLIEQMTDEVPCYEMRFDRSGEIVNDLITLEKENFLDK